MRQLLPRAPAAGHRRCLAAAAASMPSAGAPTADANAAANANAPRAMPTTTTAPNTSTKPTLVCLHGYLQNAALFRNRTGSLRKGIKSRAGEFVYVDAPYEASEARTVVWVSGGEEGGGGGGGQGRPAAGGGGGDDAAAAAAAAAAADAAAAAASSGSATDNETDTTAAGRSWFCWEEVRQRAPPPSSSSGASPPPPPTTRPSHATRYTGWEASFQAIASALKSAAAAAEGEAPRPADDGAAPAPAPPPRLGLVGFSQGAAAGALFLSDLAERQARGESADVPFPAFAVLCAGFMPRDPACAGLIERRRAGGVPVLVVTGEQDRLVPRERSDALVAALRGAGGGRAPAAREWLHPGGHLLPTCSGAFKEALVAFLDEAEAGAGR